jgi:hypothetical protein
MNNVSFIQWDYESIKERHAELLAEAEQRRMLQRNNPTTKPWSTRLWRILSLRSEQRVNAWLQQPEPIDEALCN